MNECVEKKKKETDGRKVITVLVRNIVLFPPNYKLQQKEWQKNCVVVVVVDSVRGVGSNFWYHGSILTGQK